MLSGRYLYTTLKSGINNSIYNSTAYFYACVYGCKCYWCIKGGYGSVGQSFKYDKPSSHIDEFGFIQPGQVYQAKCKGLFESNGKTASFIIKEIEFINKDGKK